MNFAEKINWYYNTEIKHCFFNAMTTGIILIICSLIVYCYSGTNNLMKGLAIPLIICGLFASVGGFVAGNSAKRELPEKLQLYMANRNEFIKLETLKVDKIKKGWTGIRIFWSIPVIVGLLIIFLFQDRFFVGVAIGCLIIGTIGHIEEIISYQHNEVYRLEVKKSLSMDNKSRY